MNLDMIGLLGVVAAVALVAWLSRNDRPEDD